MPDRYLRISGDPLQKQINVVLLHCLWADTGSGAPLEPMRVSTFKWLVGELARQGYHFLSSEEVYQYYQGRTNIPAKNVFLTFDDGYADNHVYGTPILKEFGARASINTEWNKLASQAQLGGRTSLAQLAEMAASGVWDIDTHGYIGHGGAFPPGYDYRDYTGQPYRDRLFINSKNRYMTDEEHKALIRADMLKSKEIAEAITGRPVRIWPYPGGNYGQDGNDPNNIPRLTFEVLDELGIIGFGVSGERITPYSTRHKGRRPAWTKPEDLFSTACIGLDEGAWLSVVRVGDRYLSSGYNYLQWHKLDMHREGQAFNPSPGVGGNAKVVYDPIHGDL